MSSYTTLSAVKSWADFKTDTDDDLLDSLIDTASDIIERYTGTKFAVNASDHIFYRYGGYSDNKFDGRTLLFHEWLADEAEDITDSPSVIYLPEDGPPYYGCYLYEGSWAYPSVTINGHWAYSKTAPPSIEQACLRLVKWLYDMKDAYTGAEAIITPEGQVLLPSGLPYDVAIILAPFKGLALA